MRISLVVAAARNGVIGRDGTLPWSLPGDLKRFRELTMGKPVLMGRRTWESLPRKPLPGRDNLVVSRSVPPGEQDGARWFAGLDAALDWCRGRGVPEVAVIGGAELFRETLPLADIVHLTRIEQDVEGDTVMPPLGPEWAAMEPGPLLTENGLDYRYVDYRRAASTAGP
ncbi:dihydrofolate reductase [Azospirillum brasilense]|uniref:dihydrofolate reductase n=1 Tax=Azospirillum brasilense TaxID=192 RepID=UPI000E67A2FF|nr:dihydrofolate reductase [Azospirillum brasilense]NUB25455.1 dihydrofolate reductase [Azospirillum brasilense]NUB29970.1 dihydrofolate reductase [Azospirillum brasilense]RIW05479.1 dihydrofolate reductase [Azospirillum brasilense]